MKWAKSILSVIGLILVCAAPLAAQTSSDTSKSQRSRQTQSAAYLREQARAQANESVLFLLGGQLGAAYIQLAQDISVVVNDGPRLRVLPIVGEAAVQNVRDLLLLRGVDLALTTTQALNHLRATGEEGPGLDRQIAYIAPLFHDTVQILARQGIETLQDLKGKKVGFNNRGSATALFAPQLFKSLGVDAQEFYFGQAEAVEKLRAGEIDATVCACPMPVPAFLGIKPESGFKLLEVPFSEAMLESHLPAAISHEEYPALLAKDAKIETIATHTLLITFNWPKDSTRYARTAKFVEAFFSKFSELQKPPRHPLWKTSNIAATVPGWTRFPAAQEWLDREHGNQPSALQSNFQQYIAKRSTRQPGNEAVDNNRLFREFLDWMGQGRRSN